MWRTRSKLKEQNRLLSESAIAIALKPNERESEISASPSALENWRNTLASSPSPRGIGISRKLSRTLRQVSLRAARAGKDPNREHACRGFDRHILAPIVLLSRNEDHVYLHAPFRVA
jgi:hypothetical protein